MFSSLTNRTNPIPGRTIWTWLAVLLISTSNAMSQDRDRVFPTKGGAAATGRITERTRDKIVLESNRGTTQSFDTIDVERVVYDGEPQSLSRAKDSIVQGQYDQAETEIADVAVSALKTDAMKEDFGFYKAYLAAAQAMRGKGDLVNATKLLLDWAKTYPSSPNFYAASETLGNLAIALGVPNQASRYYGAVAGAPFPELKLRGGYLQGKALLLQGEVDEARSKLAAVTQASVADAPMLKIQKMAAIGLIQCDAAQGKGKDAVASLEKMVDEGDSSDAELFAALFNSLGAIYASQNNHQEALLSFLKTHLLYSTQADAHAEALYNLSVLWSKLGEPLRAADAKSELVKLYPNSSWAKK
ncbi:tetratricopeptide repeat protein [Pirellulaceae bacterium SH467]